MTPFFVFCEDIEKALRAGKEEIELPEGARISAAALDLIKERKVRITYRSRQPEIPEAREGLAKAQEPKGIAASRAIRDNSDSAPGDVISEEDVEDIVKRVIKRFRELKGEEPAELKKRDVSPTDDDDLIICRCEEITKGDIKEAIRNGMRTLNGIKRVTRAGMGLCQGQTCQRLVSQILASELGLPPGELEPTTARAPVRPVKLSVLATG